MTLIRGLTKEPDTTEQHEQQQGDLTVTILTLVKKTGREHFQELNRPKACSVNEDVQKHDFMYLLIKQGPEHGERNVQEHLPL